MVYMKVNKFLLTNVGKFLFYFLLNHSLYIVFLQDCNYIETQMMEYNVKMIVIAEIEEHLKMEAGSLLKVRFFRILSELL
jgi:hypothetical protein